MTRQHHEDLPCHSKDFLILDRVSTGGSNERIGTFRYFIGYSGRDQHG